MQPITGLTDKEESGKWKHREGFPAEAKRQREGYLRRI